jgi:invasion protein IalB
MLLRNKRGRQTPGMVGGAVLCVLAFSSWAVAQTLPPKPAQPAPASPAPNAQPAPQPNWSVSCTKGQAGLDCRAIQSISLPHAGPANPQLGVAVRVPPDTKKPQMLLLLPLGLYLPEGVSVQFGGSDAKRVPIESCDPTGCLTNYPVSEAEIGAMLKGTILTISVYDRDKQPVVIKVPPAGFGEAYAKIMAK